MTRARDIANFGDGIATADIGDGQVTAGKLNSTLDLSGKTVTLPSGVGGKVLQVVQGTTSTETSVTSLTFVDIGLSASITPTSTSSKILIMCSVQTRVFIATTGNGAALQIVRDSTAIFSPGSPGNYEYGYNNRAAYSSTSEESYRVPLMYLDSPSSTSSLTYKIQAKQRQALTGNKVDFQDDDGFSSTIILMEIAG